ncbi:hypothetical protein V8C86DRAFT_2536804, partial [Haematococcus lacustris]
MDSTLPHEIAPGCQAQAPPLLLGTTKTEDLSPGPWALLAYQAAMTTSAVDSPRLSPAAALFIPTNRTSTSPVAPDVSADAAPSPLASPLTSPCNMLLSPTRRRTPAETRVASAAKQARAEQSRTARVTQRLAKLAAADEGRQLKLASVKESSEKDEERRRMEEKIARSEALRHARLAAVVQRAGEEARKVAEVAFINQMQEEDRKLSLQQKLEEGSARRRGLLDEKLLRRKEAAATVEGAAERRRAAELQRQA